MSIAGTLRSLVSGLRSRIGSSSAGQALFGGTFKSGIFGDSLYARYRPTTATSPFLSQLRNSHGIGTIAGGYGIYKATQKIGEELDVANERAGRGSAYGTIVKGAGMVTGGAMALVGGAKMIGQQARILGNTFDTEKYKTLHAMNRQEIQKINRFGFLSPREKGALARGDKSVSEAVTKRLKSKAEFARSGASRYPAGSPDAIALTEKAEFAEFHVGSTRGYTPKDIVRLKSEVPKDLRDINTGRKSLNYKRGSEYTIYDEYKEKDGSRARMMDKDLRTSVEPELLAVDKELTEAMARTTERHGPKITEATEGLARAKAAAGPPMPISPAPLPSTIASPTPVVAPPPMGPVVPPTIAAPPTPAVIKAEADLAKAQADLSVDIGPDSTRARAKKDILKVTAPDRHFIFKNTPKPTSGFDKFADFTEGMPRKALELIAPAAADAGLGIAAAPIAPFMLMKHGFAHSNYVGSAIFGMGLYAGAGSAIAGGSMFDGGPRDRAALGGTAVFDPNAGGRPRRSGMDPSVSNTAGLVQSLHKMR